MPGPGCSRRPANFADEDHLKGNGISGFRRRAQTSMTYDKLGFDKMTSKKSNLNRGVHCQNVSVLLAV